jgi:hypothetical protein
MTKAKKGKTIKLLKELKEESKQKAGIRSTAVDCIDFLLAVLGERV